ncbi:MAG TPA: NUDIX hydrolase [Verrucomicrobiae bacterium]|nr:NUDIX hydrolase [Verrucomicrobiae bacterium]
MPGTSRKPRSEMDNPSKLPWLDWCRKLAAIAQNGLTYARDPYDVERYSSLREIAAEMVAAGSGADISRIRDLLGKDTGYATPKVDVRGVVFQWNKILLVQEQSDGKWAVPGGWADVCESPSENVTREVFEETGYRVRCAKLVAVLDRSKHPHEPPFLYHIYKLFLECEILSGEAKPGADIQAVGFFGEKEIPALSLTRITMGQLAMLFEHHKNPDQPAGFD